MLKEFLGSLPQRFGPNSSIKIPSCDCRAKNHFRAFTQPWSYLLRQVRPSLSSTSIKSSSRIQGRRGHQIDMRTPAQATCKATSLTVGRPDRILPGNLSALSRIFNHFRGTCIAIFLALPFRHSGSFGPKWVPMLRFENCQMGKQLK